MSLLSFPSFKKQEDHSLQSPSDSIDNKERISTTTKNVLLHQTFFKDDEMCEDLCLPNMSEDVKLVGPKSTMFSLMSNKDDITFSNFNNNDERSRTKNNFVNVKSPLYSTMNIMTSDHICAHKEDNRETASTKSVHKSIMLQKNNPCTNAPFMIPQESYHNTSEPADQFENKLKEETEMMSQHTKNLYHLIQSACPSLSNRTKQNKKYSQPKLNNNGRSSGNATTTTSQSTGVNSALSPEDTDSLNNRRLDVMSLITTTTPQTVEPSTPGPSSSFCNSSVFESPSYTPSPATSQLISLTGVCSPEKVSVSTRYNEQQQGSAISFKNMSRSNGDFNTCMSPIMMSNNRYLNDNHVITATTRYTHDISPSTEPIGLLSDFFRKETEIINLQTHCIVDRVVPALQILATQYDNAAKLALDILHEKHVHLKEVADQLFSRWNAYYRVLSNKKCGTSSALSSSNVDPWLIEQQYLDTVSSYRQCERECVINLLRIFEETIELEEWRCQTQSESLKIWANAYEEQYIKIQNAFNDVKKNLWSFNAEKEEKDNKIITSSTFLKPTSKHKTVICLPPFPTTTSLINNHDTIKSKQKKLSSPSSLDTSEWQEDSHSTIALIDIATTTTAASTMLSSGTNAVTPSTQFNFSNDDDEDVDDNCAFRTPRCSPTTPKTPPAPLHHRALLYSMHADDDTQTIIKEAPITSLNNEEDETILELPPILLPKLEEDQNAHQDNFWENKQDDETIHCENQLLINVKALTNWLLQFPLTCNGAPSNYETRNFVCDLTEEISNVAIEKKTLQQPPSSKTMPLLIDNPLLGRLVSIITRHLKPPRAIFQLCLSIVVERLIGPSHLSLEGILEVSETSSWLKTKIVLSEFGFLHALPTSTAEYYVCTPAFSICLGRSEGLLTASESSILQYPNTILIINPKGGAGTKFNTTRRFMNSVLSKISTIKQRTHVFRFPSSESLVQWYSVLSMYTKTSVNTSPRFSGHPGTASLSSFQFNEISPLPTKLDSKLCGSPVNFSSRSFSLKDEGPKFQSFLKYFGGTQKSKSPLPHSKNHCRS